MLKELIENKQKYFWSFNSDGDLTLGNNDMGLKATLTFTQTPKWVNVAPLIEATPGNYLGKSETFIKGTEEYTLINQLTKEVKEYLKTNPKQNREKVSLNTLKLLQRNYKKRALKK